MSNLNMQRIVKEKKELETNPPTSFLLYPMEDDVFEWHFTLMGTPDSDYEGGLYHGRIILPKNYPLSAPDLIFMTPSGRFEVGTKICLSMTKYHPEHWSPVWTVRKMLEAIQAFMPIDEQGVGALAYASEDRKKIAAQSRNYQCPVCSHRLKDDEVTISKNREVSEEAHKREKRDRLLSEKLVQEQTALKEEEIKQYYLKKSIDESDLPDQLRKHMSEPVPLFGASPKGVFGAGPNIPCFDALPSSDEQATLLGKRVTENRQQSKMLGETATKLRTETGQWDRPNLIASMSEPNPSLRQPVAPQHGQTVRNQPETQGRMMEDERIDPVATTLTEIRDRSRALMEDLLARRDVVSLEAILRSEIAQGALRAENIMSTQYSNFLDKINKVTHLHKDQVYDSLGGLLDEAIEMQTVSRSIEFHESEASKDEAEKERRRKHDEARAREMRADEEGHEEEQEQGQELTEEERIKQSAEYRHLQKRQKFLDFMIYSLVFVAISYFAFDVVKLMFGL